MQRPPPGDTVEPPHRPGPGGRRGDARYSKQPISINHTGCRALTDLPRNKTDEELKLVADQGGFVGIYFMPFLNLSGHATAADVVAHIEHAVNVCGEDHVGIGTDGGTTPIDDLEAYKAALSKEHDDRVAKGIVALGERADTHPFVDDLRGPDQFRKLRAVCQRHLGLGTHTKRLTIRAGSTIGGDGSGWTTTARTCRATACARRA